MKKFKAYTDGSYQSSIDAGGYASIIYDENDNVVAKLYQGFKHTTNNRMEARAVLETLKYFKEPTDITIVSDSMYVVNTINQGWAKK
jgi:ribonuclease HI